MRNRITSALCASLFAAASLLRATPLQAEVHAVLVGVGDYQWLDADLRGPPNDVRLMAEVLAGRGVSPGAMTVLTTDPTGLPEGVTHAPPDRAGIFASLEAATGRAKPGDTILFYFSGHGSQAPDLNGDEGGGYDEIFLPMDAKGWQGEIGMVENAIVDDELQIWAQSVLARGVKLVGIIDACHSATGFRAIAEPGDEGEAAGVARSLEPGSLGIPETLPPGLLPETVPAQSPGPVTGLASGPAGLPVAPPETLSGDFVFLYSSQADERSFEYPLGDSGIWHGEFTLRLAQVLSTAGDATWQQVLAATSDAMIPGLARQVPDGEGSLLQDRVFGEGAGSTRFRINGAVLQAGLLQGFAEGGEVLLYADGAGGESLGAALLGKVSAREARLAGPLPEGAAWAAPGRLPEAEPLRLAAARHADPGDGQDYAQWEAALALHPAGVPGKPADLVPVLTDGGLALTGPDGILDPDGPGSSPRVLIWEEEAAADALERVLATMAHGARLRDVLSGAAGRGLTRKEVISVTIERRAGEEITESGAGTEAQAGAQAETGCSGKAGPGAPHDPARGVAGCDQLWLTLTNRSGRAQDVTVLYLTAGMEVLPIWPAQNIVNRIAPGEATRVGLQIDPVTARGTEEIWILAVPMGETPALRADLTVLARSGMRSTEGGAQDEMGLWLEGQLLPAEDSASLRGFSTKPADLTMIRQIVRLIPPAS